MSNPFCMCTARGTVWLVVLATTASSSWQLEAQADQRLTDAVERRDRSAIQQLLQEDVDVNTPQADGATALSWAVHWDDLELAEELIRRGADVNAANALSVTPLMLAALNGSGGMVERLLRAGARPETSRASGGDTALLIAARTGDVEVVDRLLASGAEVDATTSRGQTALMWAVAERHADVAELLLDHGADVSARTTATQPASRGYRPRPSPAPTARSKTEAVNPATLPREGAGDPPRVEGGFTPLLYAVLVDDLDSVRVLLAGGANVNDASADGVTALMLAITKRHGPAALFLLERGADPNVAVPGYTALHLAAGTGQLEVVTALLARGADPNARMARPQRFTEAFEVGTRTSPGAGRVRQSGSTPLLVAAKTGHPEVMRVLVDAGADPLLTTEDGTTAVMLAAGLGKRANTDITYYQWSEDKAIQAVGLGLELGVPVNAANETGETALHAATYHAANDLVEYLVRNGADLNVTNWADQTPFLLAEGHLVCCTTFVQHPSTSVLLRELGADPALGTRLTFGLGEYAAAAEEGAPPTPR